EKTGFSWSDKRAYEPKECKPHSLMAGFGASRRHLIQSGLNWRWTGKETTNGSRRISDKANTFGAFWVKRGGYLRLESGRDPHRRHVYTLSIHRMIPTGI
ncbi:hypothetical protein AVEN_128806-1, partial [Araneus ventricosus]